MTKNEIAELIASADPSIDADRVYEDSAGNPLFALELSRSFPDALSRPPSSLREIVRDRIERVPESAAPTYSAGLR